MNDPSQIILTLGAAGALFYVLKLIVDGKLHSSSEVDGIRADKKELLAVNARMADAIDKSNDQLTMIIELLREDPPSGPS